MRSKNIDILKTICSFLIVCIHIPFPGTAGQYFIALSRIAVPIFFMITGYFYSDIVRRGEEVRQIRKILFLVIQANLLYLIWRCFYAVMSQNIVLFTSTFSAKNLFKFLFLNESPLSGHLWYLGAILYVLIIIYIVNKLKLEKYLYRLIPVLLLGDLLLGKYSLVLWDREFPYILVRNFLFVGIPYFCIGRLIREGLGQKISRNVLSGLIVLFSLTSLLERFILVSIRMNATRDHYISTTLLAISVFLFTLKLTKGYEENYTACKLSSGDYATNLMSVIGRRHSTWLYILHPIFITCIGAVANIIGVYEIYRVVAPIVVYIATLVFLAIVHRIKQEYIIRWR